jgi:hypothetical protein
MSEDLQSVKFGIALPKPVVQQIEEEARKVGMTRSEFIAKVLTGELRNNREREAVVSGLKTTKKRRTSNDNLPYIHKLIEDSQDWLGGFDLRRCASQAKARLLTGQELDPTVHPDALKAILLRFKAQAEYWGYSEERKKLEVSDFAKEVGLTGQQVMEEWTRVSEEGT